MTIDTTAIRARIDRLAAAREKATQYEWCAFDGIDANGVESTDVLCGPPQKTGLPPGVELRACECYGENQSNNAAFIALAANELPLLAPEVRGLLEEVERLRAACKVALQAMTNERYLKPRIDMERDYAVVAAALAPTETKETE